METRVFKLIDRQSGELAFSLFPFEGDLHFNQVQRHNYYSIILIHSGACELNVELMKYNVASSAIICISPYQPYQIQATDTLKGIVLNFHPDFFCTYKHQNEIETEGVLFHNIFEPNFFDVIDEEPLRHLLEQMKKELEEDRIGQHQQLVSYLKIFLVSIVRIKKSQSEDLQITTNKSPRLITELVNYIEKHYRQKHSTGDYARLLNISTSALSKLVKKHFGKTLTNLIAERIVVEAKRELYLTSKTVKEISFLMGYNDEYYFSRFFKKHTGISPSVYRNTVGFAKQEN